MSRAQLLRAGLRNGGIEWRLRTGRLHTLHRGVYAVGHRAVGGRGREMAAVLACGPGAVLSHQSAAALWEFRGPWRGPVHVSTLRDGARRGVIVHRVRAIDPRDVTTHRAIPVTTPTRTLLDLADHARLVVELDGFAYHAHRRAFEDDRARDAALQARGERVIRLTHRRLDEHAAAVAGDLRRLL